MRTWVFSAGGIDASAKLLSGKGKLFAGHPISLTCLLVERPGGLVLVDTGWGTPTADDPRRYPGTAFALTSGTPHVARAETALGRIEALGFRAEDVTDIVLTHLDIDHVGGLVDFPGARVHVARADHAAWFAEHPSLRVRLHDSRRAFDHGPRFALADFTDHVELGFPRSADLFGDGSVVLLDAAGHTAAHAAVLVHTAAGRLLHAGDAFLARRELEGDDDLPLGVRLYRRTIHEDRRRAATTLARLREVRREHPDVALVNAHDATLLAALPAFPTSF